MDCCVPPRLRASARSHAAGSTMRSRAGGLRRLRLLALLAFCLAGVARAHDPLESWTNAVLHPDRLAVELTIAQRTALLLVDAHADFPALTPDNFAAYHARLKARATELYVLTSGRTALAPREVEVRLTEEEDIAFTLVYPRPAAGRLHFHATFLTRLGEGYGGTIYLSDPAGKDLGWDQISWENPDFEASIAAPGPVARESPSPPR